MIPHFETTSELPRRAVDQHVRCANPSCLERVPVTGEFCQLCRNVQAKERTRFRELTTRKASY